jgi:hypothetical protein
MKPAEKVLMVQIGLAASIILGASQYVEWRDQSWGALHTAIFLNPIANLVVTFVGLGVMFGKIGSGDVRGKVGYPVVLLIPFVAGWINFFSLGLMSLRGC